MRTLKLSVVMALVLVALVLIMGCSKSGNEKVADAKANVVVAQQGVTDAVDEAQTAWLKYKSDAEARIAVNEQIIADYKIKMTNSDGKLQAAYDRKIDALETKNRELKAKLEAYKDTGKTEWERFQSEFGRDMNELGTALKDFVVDSKK
jgi:ribosome-associated translation inhibitor RaiA